MNVSTSVGIVVGVLITLIVGIVMFGEVANEIAEFGDRGFESYEVGVYEILPHDDPDGCDSPAMVQVTAINEGDGSIRSVTFPRGFTGSGCDVPDGYASYTLGLLPAGTPNAATLIGENFEGRAQFGSGQVLIVAGAWNNGQSRVIYGRDLRQFTGLEPILNVMPTILLIGLLSAGGAVGGAIGRSVGARRGQL